MHKVRQFIKSSLSEKASKINDFTAILYQCVPLDLIGHCAVIDLRAGSISLVANSSAWASRLRYHRQPILDHFSKTLAVDCHSLTIRVQTRTMTYQDQESSQKVSDRPPISAATASALKEIAKTCDDPELAKSLQRLASRKADK